MRYLAGILLLLWGGGVSVALAEGPAPVETPRSGYNTGSSSYPASGQSVATPLPAGASAKLQMLDRMTELQQELQTLRNQIEQLSHETEGLKRRQRDAYIDLDNRLSQIEQNPAATPVGGATTVAPDTMQTDAAAATPSTSVTPPVERVGLGPASRAEADEQARYQSAFSMLKAGRYDSSITAFQSFLQLYPATALSDNALYWIGEAYYVTQRFDQAGTEFRSVMERYPHSDKVPDALLKLGYVHYEQAAWADARQTLSQLQTLYPTSTAARLAENRLARMASEGR